MGQGESGWLRAGRAPAGVGLRAVLGALGALGLLGVTSFAELSPAYVRKAEVIGPTHELSTFYHLPQRLV